MADLYLDENLPNATVGALQQLGHTAVHARTAVPRTRVPDHVHLVVAATAGRILVTKDGGFVMLHQAWQHWVKAWGLVSPPQHAGILIVQDRWGPARIAQAVNDLLRSQQPVTNRLFRWMTGSGWVELH